MSLEVVAALRKYLEDGDHSGFGSRDPFRRFGGGGSAEGIAKTLAREDMTVDDCPVDDTRYSAMLFGELVGSSALDAADRGVLRQFMEIAYEEHVADYYKGINGAKTLRAEASRAEQKGGAHGGNIPTRAEADEIFKDKGMTWKEVVVVSSVLFSGTVPTVGEIEKEGYGSDPGQWDSAKELRKHGKPNLYAFLKSRDAAGYRAMITRGATRMASNGDYSTGAAKVMLFVNKLSKMTFDQGMPGLFLDYCEEHIETHKGRGLASRDNPLDQTVLTETVLAEKVHSKHAEERIDKALGAIDTSGLDKMKSRMGEVSAMTSKVAMLERELRELKSSAEERSRDRSRGGGLGGPPSEDNVCSYCKSPDHFIRDCPKKKEADARKAAAAAAATIES